MTLSHLSIAAVAATTVLLTACEELPSTTQGESGEASIFMNQEELLKTFRGARIYGTSSVDDKTQWIQTYSKTGTSGTISGLWAGETYMSSWYVKGDMWCEKWDTGESCWSIQRIRTNELQAYLNGTEKLKNVWLIK